jgi:hypothetical protein
MGFLSKLKRGLIRILSCGEKAEEPERSFVIVSSRPAAELTDPVNID